MKKLIYILISINVVLSFSSCDSKIVRKATGDWNFVTVIVEANTDSMGYYTRDTVYFSGIIHEGKEADEIIIKYAPDTSITCKINSEGDLIFGLTSENYGNIYDDNKIFIYLRRGGHGAFITNEINGEKH